MLISVWFSTALAAAVSQAPFTETLHDAKRQRDIPLEIVLPVKAEQCRRQALCKVAFISPGGGLAPQDYGFIRQMLNQQGYLTVGIQSVLATDPPDGKSGIIRQDRMPGWQLGADNLLLVKQVLAPRYPDYNWDELVLIGHSNGGDISALALAQHPDLARVLITLDSRRYPLPVHKGLRLLSIRGSDFPADPGVLPEQRSDKDSCIRTIANSKHNDMNDRGPEWLKDAITSRIQTFLAALPCHKG